MFTVFMHTHQKKQPTGIANINIYTVIAISNSVQNKPNVIACATHTSATSWSFQMCLLRGFIYKIRINYAYMCTYHKDTKIGKVVAMTGDNTVFMSTEFTSISGPISTTS